MYGNACDRAYSQYFQRYCNINFKKTEKWIQQVNYDYIENKSDIEVDIIAPESLKEDLKEDTKKDVKENVVVDAAEMDEMWSFVGKKADQEWLWWAIDHNTGEPLAYCFGTREHKYLDKLKALLKPFKINIVYSDNNFAYKKHIRKSKVITGKNRETTFTPTL